MTDVRNTHSVAIDNYISQTQINYFFNMAMEYFNKLALLTIFIFKKFVTETCS